MHLPMARPTSDLPGCANLRDDADAVSPSARTVIELAREEHVTALPAIELAAAVLLAGHAPAEVLTATTDPEIFREAQREGRLWVALASGVPVGLALIETLHHGHAHLEEMDVDPSHGRRGVGARLLAAVLQGVRRSGCERITLTTFASLPWNMPFYAKWGFVPIGSQAWCSELRSRVREEAARGLPPGDRVVMERRFH